MTGHYLLIGLDVVAAIVSVVIVVDMIKSYRRAWGENEQ